MKLTIIISILFFAPTSIFSQFSIGGGLTNPIGSYAEIENNAAKLGYQISANYDISLDRKYGISTGLLIGQNSLKDNSSKFNKGQWSYVLIEVGGFVRLLENIKLKGLISTGSYATPELNYENSATVILNELSVGLDLKIEYNFNNFYIGSNYLYSNPNFVFPSGSSTKYSFSIIGLIIGHSF